jgi:hypothetical protein
MKHRPSSLPAVAACARFKGGQGNEFTEAGNSRHKTFADCLRAGLDSDDSGVQWALDYVRIQTPADSVYWIEEKLEWTGPDFDKRSGTPDVVCGTHIFDLKSRPRDYLAQMADYVCGVAQDMLAHDDTVFTIHLLFTETERFERFELTTEEARNIVAKVLDSAESPDAKPTPCDYCSWCSNRLTCAALTAQAKRVLDGYSDDEAIKQWHPSKMETPEEIAAALSVWRKVLKGWGESVEFHALDAVKKRGMELTGYKLANESGGQYISDVAAAYAALGLPQDVFLSACEPRMNTSKKYPDRVGLIGLFATAHGAKPAKAKKEVIARLGDALKDKARKVYLKAANEAATTEEQTND